MRRNDWSFVSNLTADGYWIGFHLLVSTKNSRWAPNRQPLQIGAESRIIMAGNRVRRAIDNQSIFEAHISNEPLKDFKKIPDFPYKDIHLFRQRPDRAALYVATDAPFNVKANDNTVDNTQPLQAALDHATRYKLRGGETGE